QARRLLALEIEHDAEHDDLALACRERAQALFQHRREAFSEFLGPRLAKLAGACPLLTASTTRLGPQPVQCRGARDREAPRARRAGGRPMCVWSSERRRSGSPTRASVSAMRVSTTLSSDAAGGLERRGTDRSLAGRSGSGGSSLAMVAACRSAHPPGYDRSAR